MSNTALYEAITDKIIAQLEKGIIPWKKPWQDAVAIKRSNGKPYSLLNQLLLEEPGEYATFNAIKAAGGHVKKGEKGRFVVFFKFLTVKDEDDEEETIPFLQKSIVFNVATQCEGIEPKYIKPVENPAEPVEQAEQIIRDYVLRSGVKFMNDAAGSAYYQPATDSIHLPAIDQFISSPAYYDTAFHEMTHSTGHESRLNRLADGATFGSTEYSKEELVAELGAAFLMGHTRMETPDTENNNAAYIQSWIKALQNDRRMIVSASSKAQKAVNMILGISDSEAE